jgi:hypothetical protein
MYRAPPREGHVGERENLRQHLSGVAPGRNFRQRRLRDSEMLAVRTASYEGWAKFMEEQGLSPAEAQQQFAEWAKEDYYPPLATELRLLAEAGFCRTGLLWRTNPVHRLRRRAVLSPLAWVRGLDSDSWIVAPFRVIGAR